MTHLFYRRSSAVCSTSAVRSRAGNILAINTLIWNPAKMAEFQNVNKPPPKLRGKLYLSRKRSVGAPDGNKNRKSKSYQSDNFETEQKTHEVVAKETGVSPRTIKRDAAYAEAAS